MDQLRLVYIVEGAWSSVIIVTRGGWISVKFAEKKRFVTL